MLKNFTKIQPEMIPDSCFKLIGKDWMLITAGSIGNYNTMTASWGQLGILWNLPVAVCYIRPQRFTFDFIENSDYYTLSFFEEKYRKVLEFCGSKSGRDWDKAKETGISPIETGNGVVSFEEARLILECKKLYAGNIKAEEFIAEELIKKNYPKSDFHRFYIGELVNVWSK